MRLGRHERIAREGWTLVQVYRDAAMSGATTLRPGYQALLEGAREAGFDVVVAEALDRLSRDQEDVAALYKRLQFAGIRLVTLGEGEIGPLHIGLKGTMNALFLKDLADKTRRGLRGRVEAGQSGGGNAYGYDVVRRLDASGDVARGERRINEVEAAIVREIFARYAAGESPKRIALDLNARAIPAPRGGAWSASTLNGNRARGTGVLNNEAYIGRLVWNRLSYVKDPDTGRRRSRANADAAVVAVDAPDLTIVPPELWQAVKSRQAALGVDRGHEEKDSGTKDDEAARPFWSKQRPRYLFSGQMRCGVCGGGFSKISAAHFGCSTARNKGDSRMREPPDYPPRHAGDDGSRRPQEPADGPRPVQDLRLRHSSPNGTGFRRKAAPTAPASPPNATRSSVRSTAWSMRSPTAAPSSVRRKSSGSSSGAGSNSNANWRRLRRQRRGSIPISPTSIGCKVAGLVEALAADDAGAARELIRGLVEAIVLIPEDGRAARSRCAASWRRSCVWRRGRTRKAPAGSRGFWLSKLRWLRGQDLNLRPSGYEPDELPGCSTPRCWCQRTDDRGRKTDRPPLFWRSV